MWLNYNMIDVSDDLYALLEVSSFATQDEIKRAYHALAKKYHPDVYHGPDSEQRFKKINSAYQILSNPKQRAEYDLFVNTIKNKTQSSTEEKSGTSKQSDLFDFVDIDHNLYTELELDLFASIDAVEKSYEDLAEKYKPDISLVPNAREKLRRISFAYTILSDYVLKERYDYFLRILVTNSPKKDNTGKQQNSQSATKKSNSSSYSAAASKSSSANSYSSSSSGNANSYRSSYQYREKQTDDRYKPAQDNKLNNGCGKLFVFLLLMFFTAFLLAICSTNEKSNSTDRRSYNTSSYYQPTSTVSISVKTIFNQREIEIEIGKIFYLGFELPDNKNYTYYCDHNYIETTSLENKISLKGIKVGKTTIEIYNDMDQVVDSCTVIIKSAQKTTMVPTSTKNSNTQKPMPTATKKSPTRTPTPISEWSFEKEKVNVKVGETIELHFTTPRYAIYTYIPEKYGIFTTHDKNPSTVLITGFKPGTGKLYLRNDKSEIVAECIITVISN